MERFAVVVALIVAGVFTLHALAPHGIITIDHDWDESGWEDAAPAPADQIVNLDETVFAAAAIKAIDAAIVLEIIPEDRADIAISIANAGPLPTPQVRLEGDVAVIDGMLGGRVSCRGDGNVVVHGRGGVGRDSLPVVRVRAPRELVFTGEGGGGRIEIGDAASASLRLTGCADVAVASVEGALDLQAQGSGDVSVGLAGEAAVRLNGAGDVIIAQVTRVLQLELDGSSAFEARLAEGAIATLALRGSGDIEIGGGPLGQLEAVIDGSGDVEVDAGVTGPVVARISGSGDVVLDGVVGALNAVIEGSGTVEVDGVRGSQTRVVHGSGEVRVGDAGAGLPPAPPPPATQSPAPPAPAAPPPP